MHCTVYNFLYELLIALYEYINYLYFLTAGQYARKLYLNVHMGKHNDVRPWKCKLCPAAFKYQCSLITHRAVHEGALYTVVCIRIHVHVHASSSNTST